MPEPIRCPAKGALEIEKDGKQFGTFVATVPPIHTLDDVLSPDYFGRWQSRGPADKMLRQGDFIDIRPADWSWYVRVMVRACLPSVDKVITAAVIQPVQFEIGEIPDGWSIEYKGAELKWTVYYGASERAARFKTAEEARAKVMEMSGADEPAHAPKNKGGRPRKVAAESVAQTEPA